jgi:Rieske Fe-S protein
LGNNLTRHVFLKIVNRLVAITGLTAVFGPVLAYFYPKELVDESPVPVRVAPIDEFPIGESYTVPFGRYPALAMNTSEGLKAYSAVCTHFACIVYWNPSSGMIECPCHAGFYDPLDGSVISGPPPAPLKVLSTEVVDGLLFVKSEGD